MATIFFSLHNVPESEADDVRLLLDNNAIDWYETSAGNWGISSPAIWLNNDEQLIRAKQCLDKYQQQRALDAQEDYKNKLINKEAPTLKQHFFRNPLAVLLAIVGIAILAYFSIMPFFSLNH
jgi:hypothetical protein